MSCRDQEEELKKLFQTYMWPFLSSVLVSRSVFVWHFELSKLQVKESWQREAVGLFLFSEMKIYDRVELRKIIWKLTAFYFFETWAHSPLLMFITTYFPHTIMQTLFGNRITLQYVQSDIITRAVVKITFTQVHFGGT